MFKKLTFIFILLLSVTIYAEDDATIAFQAYIQELVDKTLISDAELLSFADKLENSELTNPIQCTYCTSKQLIHKKTLEEHLAYKDEFDITSIKEWLRKLLVKRGHNRKDREETRNNTKSLCSKSIIPKRLAVGSEHTCAIELKDRVICWGPGKESVPPKHLGEVCGMIDAFGDKTCVLDLQGSIQYWQTNGSGSLTLVRGELVQMSLGKTHKCILENEHTVSLVACYGADHWGQLKVPDDLGTVVQISAGVHHTCSVNDSGSVRCWGGDVHNEASIIDPIGLGYVVQVSISLNYKCALEKSGTVKCWDSSNIAELIPLGLDNVVQISAGARHVCALEYTKTVKCWGNVAEEVHSRLLELGPIVEIASGDNRICVVKETGKVGCLSWDGIEQITPPDGLEVSTYDLLKKFNVNRI